MTANAIKTVLTIPLCFIISVFAYGETPEPTSALAYQQSTNTRIVVEENHLRFFTGGSERMTIDENGNVGIGILSPSSKLEVNGESLFRGSMKLDYGGVAKGQALLYFFDRSSNGETTRNWKIATLPASTSSSGDKILVEFFGGIHDSHMTFQSTIHLANRSGFRGYVRSLYGTQHSSVRIRAYKQSDGTVDVYMSILSPSWKGACVRVYEGSAITNSRLTIYQTPENVGVSPSGTLVFDSYTSTPGITISNSGNLHAATYSADSPPTWPDYVFKDTYELNKLDQVEQYIEKNHHLPDIPSAAEVQENGIDIVDMQAKLLQKIEELTLYVIEQNKKIERLQEENKEIKNNLMQK